MSDYERDYRKVRAEHYVKDLAYPASVPRKTLTLLAAKLVEIQSSHEEAKIRAQKDVGYLSNTEDINIKKQPKPLRQLLSKLEKHSASVAAITKQLADQNVFKSYNGAYHRRLTEAEIETRKLEAMARLKDVHDAFEKATEDFKKLVAEIAEVEIAKAKKSIPEELSKRLDAISIQKALPAPQEEPTDPNAPTEGEPVESVLEDVIDLDAPPKKKNGRKRR